MTEASVVHLQNEIAELEKLLTDKKRQLEEVQAAVCRTASSPELPEITNHSSPQIKISLFRSLFRGRDDVYAKRFESKKTGKSGYQPVCRNEWVWGICEKQPVIFWPLILTSRHGRKM
ncbi:hypothetical protein AGMMS50293_01140 [Spirochaetia bacterium]|nr:hypothetical protein AGMMS50293_01140 [Spirochaetia bacterium]